MTNRTRAVSWAAVSSKPQLEGESLADQHRQNRALADEQGWELLAELTVPGESRSYYRLEDAIREVEAYRELDELARSQSFDWLIVKDRSRLGRTRRLNAEVAALLQDHGLRIWSRAIPPASQERRTEADVWGEAIESGYSEAEILRLKQRHKMGMRARVRSGKLAGILPWGFVRVAEDGHERAVFADPQAEATVRYVVARYLAGISKQTIIQECHERGYTAPQGGPMTYRTLDRLILQPAYYGLSSYGKTRTIVVDGERRTRDVPIEDWILGEGDWDAPFTPDDWERVVQEHERRLEEHPRRRAGHFPLSGIAWCSECGGYKVGLTAHAHRPTVHRYYRCAIRTDGYSGAPYTPHPSHVIPARDLHQAVIAHIASRLRDGDIAELAEQVHDAQELTAQRDALMGRLEDLARRRLRWQDAYESGVIELAEFADRLDELDAAEEPAERELARIEGELQRGQRARDVAAEVREIIVHLPERIPEELSPELAQSLRATFRRLFRRIEVDTEGNVTAVQWRL